ncbi:large ribosomal subunit protein mL46 [Ascaphus truei]|uniref:large ribosomal subunit protein mL46 n=1 Tax=Ascaphus truei TaxID=8439 RepID=UPI003F598D74
MAAPVRRLLMSSARSCGSSLVCRGLMSPAAGGGSPAGGGGSPWRLHGAVCLKRPAVVSQTKSPLQQRVAELLHQMELEKSFYSDHEIRLMEDEVRTRRKQTDNYDSDGEDGDKETIMAQDLEDFWEQKMKQYKAAPRITEADTKNDRSSLNRKLENNLVLLVKEKIGNEEIWMFPHIAWQCGETMRQSAERALSTLAENHIEAHFLGNAPCGFYKYKFPKSLRTEDNVGAKVFFFKAVLKRGDLSTVKKAGEYVWVSQDELKDYLKPTYLAEVSRFVIEL